jgi:hypothetical protein
MSDETNDNKEIKIPFDFGSARGKFYCRRHGEQNGGIAIKVDSYPDKPAIEKVYCGHCIVDALDSICPPFFSRGG